MNEPPLLKTHGLGRQFGSKAALAGVDFKVEPGQIVALLGENGAGKSTLLNLIAGCLRPTEGTIEIDRSELACMIDGHLPPDWTTPDYLVNFQEEATPRFDREKALKLLRDQRIDMKARFGSLSKGQKRWLLVTLALASNPRLVLLDEPADGLDTNSRRALYDALRDAVNEGESSAVVATHIIDDIERVADSVAVISGGKLVLHEDLDDLRDQVREVEFPTGTNFPALEGIDLIGSRTVGDTQLCTVKCSGGHHEIHDRLSEAQSIHPVRLEDLYLKLTESPS